MKLTERNLQIEQYFQERIATIGLDGILEFDPIPNTAKQRPTFYRKADGTCVFTGFMWQLNKLDDEALAAAIDARIQGAVRHFELANADGQ